MAFLRRTSARLIAGTAALLLAAPLAGQACPGGTDSVVAAGWRAWRADSAQTAGADFDRAVTLCPANVDARLGQGSVALRRGTLPRADSLFRSVIERWPGYVDAYLGLARVEQRMGRDSAALADARRALALAPDRSDVRELMHTLAPDYERPGFGALQRPDSLILVSRTRGDSFQVRQHGSWRPFYIRGVNLGAALPGKFPSEFPADSATYARWLELMAGMHANLVRLYTILPPTFYRALRAWNTGHPDAVIWLMHGVWTELPPGDDFDDAQWKGAFRAEMEHVVDLIHGHLDLPPQPGHAGGHYDADVSPWTFGYIIGREWEPYSVKAFDAADPRPITFHGRFLATGQVSRMDAWMAEQCDHLLGYEFDRWNALRPIAYTNWPTLDPLHHPTEANSDEEAVWRQRAGRMVQSERHEYENDAIGLDAMLVHATAADPAGWFASYHAYPYYPDFLDLDPGYARARSAEGPSSYFGYLSDLKRHHAGIPLVISEYGVPSSRGDAHRQPEGWDHGGHDEAAMAAIDVRMTREIRESGAAGSVLFAWLDEWFKKNWIVIDLEIPLEDTRRWHNVMDAEQNYGILGQYAGDSATTPHLGGDPRRWTAFPAVDSTSGAPAGTPSVLRIGSDGSYVYVAVELQGQAGTSFPWKERMLELAIDTWRRDLGQRVLPSGLRSDSLGFEFVLELPSPDSGELRVAPDYDPYAHIPGPAEHFDDEGRFYRRPVVTVARADGKWARLDVVTNRARFGRDGTFYPAQGIDRGVMRYGTEAGSTLSDWFYDTAAGLLEVRLPWGLLNVTDPSTRTILQDTAATGDFATVQARGFRFGVAVIEKGATPKPLGALPVLGDDGTWPAASFRDWSWEPWTEPRAHQRIKPVYAAMSALWGGWAR
jgi:hypothetical protein